MTQLAIVSHTGIGELMQMPILRFLEFYDVALEIRRGQSG